MKTYTVTYMFNGAIEVEADSEGEAQRKFEQCLAKDLAFYALDSLQMMDIIDLAPTIEEGKEGLAELKASEMVRI